MLFHLLYNVFFPQQGIVLGDVKEEIFPRSCAVIGCCGPNQIVQIFRWRDGVEGTNEGSDLSHALVPDKEMLCNASLLQC